MKKLVLIGSFLLFLSCTEDELTTTDSPKTKSSSLTEKVSSEKTNVFKGPEVKVGNGFARSWISIKKESEIPDEIGIELTPEALTELPHEDEHGTKFLIPLHLKARQLTPFNHIDLNWNPNGHLPPGVFDVPHFDFHFYLTSVAEQIAIPAWSPNTDAAFNNYPPPGYMPSNYVTPPGPATAEPQMGKHWLPQDLGEHMPFSKIMIYGSYDGKLTFIEPMITLDYLESNQNFIASYSQPVYFKKAGNYPTKYNIRHDTNTGNIYITLSDFVYRTATPY